VVKEWQTTNAAVGEVNIMDSYKFQRRNKFYFVCDCGTKHKFITEEARDAFAETQNCAKGFVKEPEVVLETAGCECEDCNCDPCTCEAEPAAIELDISNDEVEVEVKSTAWAQTGLFGKKTSVNKGY
jgi:hypothetical protein|tara:strand:+ start:418 stop:798 length:381 start_codon:yes stop_codon:yes gene_type:complete